MASTYSSLKFELIGTGDQSGTWGTTTNINLGTAIEEAITGSADVAFSSADVTLTLSNTNGAQTARNLRLNLTGTSGGTRNLTVPDIEKYYIIANNLADIVTVKNSTGSTYSIPPGVTAQVFSTGVGITDALSFFDGAVLSPAVAISGGSIDNTLIGNTTPTTGKFTTLTATSISGLTTPLSVAQGGTGTGTFTSGALLKGNGTSSIQTASAADIVSQIGSVAVTNATNSTNATQITNSGGWNVTPSGTNLFFNYNGTNVAVLDSSGNLTTIGNVTAFGTV
jgi:hypothetical protein